VQDHILCKQPCSACYNSLDYHTSKLWQIVDVEEEVVDEEEVIEVATEEAEGVVEVVEIVEDFAVVGVEEEVVRSKSKSSGK